MRYAAGLAALIICAASDIRRKEISLKSMAGCVIVAVFFIIADLYGGGSWHMPLFCLVPGLCLLGIAFVTKGMGYGDGLVMLCMGPVFGMAVSVCGIFLAFIFSAAASILLMVFRKLGRGATIPFIPFMVLGIGVSLLIV